MALTQGSRQSIPQKLQIPCLYNLFSSMPYMCLHCGTHIFAIKRGKNLNDLIQGRIKLKSFVDRLDLDLNQSQFTFHYRRMELLGTQSFKYSGQNLFTFRSKIIWF